MLRTFEIKLPCKKTYLVGIKRRCLLLSGMALAVVTRLVKTKDKKKINQTKIRKDVRKSHTFFCKWQNQPGVLWVVVDRDVIVGRSHCCFWCSVVSIEFKLVTPNQNKLNKVRQYTNLHLSFFTLGLVGMKLGKGGQKGCCHHSLIMNLRIYVYLKTFIFVKFSYINK